MMIKSLITASAIGLVSASAAFAQDRVDASHGLAPATERALSGSPDNLSYRSKETVPTGEINAQDAQRGVDALANSPNSSLTVNPPAYSYTPPAGEVVYIDGQPRQPISTDVAARTGVAVEVVTNGPVPDTPENRARYGAPMSRAGKMTTPAGN